MSTELLNLKFNGVIFHSFGAATAKARSLYVFKRTVRVAKSLCDDDRDESPLKRQMAICILLLTLIDKMPKIILLIVLNSLVYYACPHISSVFIHFWLILSFDLIYLIVSSSIHTLMIYIIPSECVFMYSNALPT